MPEARELARHRHPELTLSVCTDTADAVANVIDEVAAAVLPATSCTCRARARWARACGLITREYSPMAGLSTRRHNGVFRHPRGGVPHRRRQYWLVENLDLPAGSNVLAMDNNFSPIQRAQRRRAPTLIEPQAPYQLFWDGAMPGYWRFGDPGTRWHRRVEGVPGHCWMGHCGPSLG